MSLKSEIIEYYSNYSNNQTIQTRRYFFKKFEVRLLNHSDARFLSYLFLGSLMLLSYEILSNSILALLGLLRRLFFFPHFLVNFFHLFYFSRL